ncbi:uncharacterized protein LOC114912178 isoform X2 [Scleropages formosus]|nr:uncharacterized protein LOC108927298 isoform X2 [Scleropages formosus]XP_029106665.1 uncharacterized protein LOC108927298 isoform X2 [Scleropages formosus]XP_029106666.1 uncharacterized protein LOC108927298 isoform X2 [Scleropages formosus]XP_029112118.1 uncharacterized protein LOC114911882 isoform X2 [Scleropages formosus]XP_029112119.1 uncharacterized protein LOC114911882 isoform X2 [Scleropages formosus]XP_029112120.1 uncharacterized protein LOC114911882 isoform X2 [Scleropages formosus]
MDPAALKVLIKEQIRKLVLPLGIPNTVDELKLAVKEAFVITEEFSLQYMDSDFHDFFTLTSTDQIQHKDTVKVVFPSPVVLTFCTQHDTIPSTSTLQFEEESSAVAFIHSSSGYSGADVSTTQSDDALSSSSQDTLILSPQSSPDRLPWPQEFTIPCFSPEVQIVLEKAMEAYMRDGTLMSVQNVKRNITERLTQAIYAYTAYPSGMQIICVAEALVRKYPCLKEPGSLSGYYGWQMSLKYKMADYRRRLSKFGCPEVTCNTLKSKSPENRKPAKNVKKPRKAEVNYLPPYPTGQSEESLEQERLELLSEVKKRDNTMVIKAKMAKTFALRRHEVVNLSPRVVDFKDRWPALFNPQQINEEFRRITTLDLEPKFMQMLDQYTPNLLSIFCAKGGALGQTLQDKMVAIHQNPGGVTIDQTREVVIRCLVHYLGEKDDDLIQEYHCAETDFQQDLMHHTMKISVFKRGEQDDISIVLEGAQVVSGLGNVAKACAVLLGLTYALNLSYPKQLRYTFEAFQKLILELDTCKFSPKMQSLKNKLA